jgi:hypothetical protein
MKIAIYNSEYSEAFETVDYYFEQSAELHQIYVELIKNPGFKLSVIQRAAFEDSIVKDDITYFFCRDEYPPLLRFWQKPMSSLQKIVDLQAEIVQVTGLGSPLQFRWIRRMAGDKVKLIGYHTGEVIWTNRKIWLQQFGLRVVDGFIFKNEEDSKLWVKSAAILPRQPIYTISEKEQNINKNTEETLKVYKQIAGS